ncbi:MAG: regulatory signaling modulator protein AmpE [Pseudomonas sp.]|uniref:regulatory signaling modulator protein AmpE n=1 Tax=Pseudomonas sp. TaxID=306 RepID=UPI00324240F0
MHFLALLLVCLLMWCTPLRRALPLDIPQLWVAFAERRIAHRPLVGLALLLVPLLPVALLQAWLVTQGWGLLTLLFYVLVLLACMGRSDPLGRMTERFEAALARGDVEAAALVAEHEQGVLGGDSADVLAAMRAVLVREILHGYVVTVFWFVLLGPVGALGYRLLRLRLARDAPAGEPVTALAHALEWLPARLLAASFALVGHFDHVRQVLADALLSWDVSADDLVARTAEAALTGGEGRLADEADSGALADTRTLLKRALLAWAVVLALLAVLG